MFGLLPSIGPWELVAILAIVMIIFGPGKLPVIGTSIGKGIREFRNATSVSADKEKDAADNDIA